MGENLHAYSVEHVVEAWRRLRAIPWRARLVLFDVLPPAALAQIPRNENAPDDQGQWGRTFDRPTSPICAGLRPGLWAPLLPLRIARHDDMYEAKSRRRVPKARQVLGEKCHPLVTQRLDRQSTQPTTSAMDLLNVGAAKHHVNSSSIARGESRTLWSRTFPSSWVPWLRTLSIQNGGVRFTGVVANPPASGRRRTEEKCEIRG